MKKTLCVMIMLIASVSLGYGQMKKGEDNKAILKKFYEDVFNKHNVDAADQFITKDGIDHNPMPGIKPGLEGIKEEFRHFFTSFPDFNVTVDDMISEGDKVVARVTVKGTNKGMMNGMAATNKAAQWGMIDIVRFKDGKAVERWGYSDDVAMMTQLGLMPAPQGGMDKK